MNLEDHLQSARLSPPSGELDRRMEQTFARAEKAGTKDAPPAALAILVTLASLGIAAAVVAALLLRPPRTDQRPEVQVATQRLEARGMFQQMLVTPAASARPLPRLEVSVTSR